MKMQTTTASVFQDNQVETYDIVSRVGYLSGVEKRIFENPYEPLSLEIFRQLDSDKHARIMRHLCRIRTKLEQNFSCINTAMRYGLKNLNSLPEYIPADSLQALEADGIDLIRANRKTTQYIMDLNRHIAERICNCRNMFPDWLNWGYIRDLFIMPKGTTEQGIRQAAAEYYAHKHQLPYQVYLNWAASDQGNILCYDRKFLTLLYAQHHDHFQNFSQVSDASADMKSEIYRFLEQSHRAIMAVDCENADPYRFCGMLDSLDQNALLGHVGKIILYNDVHASSAWKSLEHFTSLPVEHHMTKRIKADKSLVDAQLITGVCREYYENGADSVVLVSSDSDYWGMISMMPQVRFLVAVERSKCSPATKAALDEAGIPYCTTDSFCAKNTGKVVQRVLSCDVRRTLTEAFNLNLLTVLERAYREARVELSESEKQTFFDRYLRTTRICFAEDGRPLIQMA